MLCVIDAVSRQLFDTGSRRLPASLKYGEFPENNSAWYSTLCINDEGSRYHW